MAEQGGVSRRPTDEPRTVYLVVAGGAIHLPDEPGLGAAHELAFRMLGCVIAAPAVIDYRPEVKR